MKFRLQLPSFHWFGGDLYWLLCLPLFVGSVNVKPVRGMLFSERNGYTPVLKLGGLCFTWVWFR